ncbi:MAG TPA: alpha/beta hydrolase [Acidobacteriaceae bacterium]|nr:alpha/beta hydrolase [Acidobacteriaceae bacterium]
MRTYLLLAISFLTVATLAPAQHVTLPLWPNGAPEPFHTKGPERDTTKASDDLIAGRRVARITNVSNPTLTIYSPDTSNNSGAAVLVFPGGSYQVLALDLEGTEVCHWLNSIGMTCVLVKYRVPVDGHYPQRVEDLEDAQQAMRLTRSHAVAWHIDPHRIGVLGFSAGAHLAAILCNHPGYKRAGAPANTPLSNINARPDFALIIYPAYLAEEPGLTQLSPGSAPTANNPPTFLVQAEDDPVHEENALLYFQALKQAKVPAELHIFTQGGHGYGLRRTQLPITNWPAYAEVWFHTLRVLSTPPTP